MINEGPIAASSTADKAEATEETITIKRSLETLNEILNVWATTLRPEVFTDFIKQKKEQALKEQAEKLQQQQEKAKIDDEIEALAKMFLGDLYHTRNQHILTSAASIKEANDLLLNNLTKMKQSEEVRTRIINLKASLTKTENTPSEEYPQTFLELFQVFLYPTPPSPAIDIPAEQLEKKLTSELKRLKQQIMNCEDEIFSTLTVYTRLTEKLAVLFFWHAVEHADNKEKKLDYEMYEKWCKIIFWLDEKAMRLLESRKHRQKAKSYHKQKNVIHINLAVIYIALSWLIVNKKHPSATDLAFSQRYLETYETLVKSIKEDVNYLPYKQAFINGKLIQVATKVKLAYHENKISKFLSYIEEAEKESTRQGKGSFPILELFCLAATYYQEKSPHTAVQYYDRAINYAKPYQSDLQPSAKQRLKEIVQAKKSLEEKILLLRSQAIEKLLIELCSKYGYRRSMNEKSHYLFIPLEKNTLTWEQCQKFSSRLIKPCALIHGSTQDLLKLQVEKKECTLQSLEYTIQRLLKLEIQPASPAAPLELPSPAQSPSQSSEAIPAASAPFNMPITVAEKAPNQEEILILPPKIKVKTRAQQTVAAPPTPRQNTPQPLLAHELGFTTSKEPVTPLYLNQAEQRRADPTKTAIFIQWQGIKGLDSKEETEFKKMLNPYAPGILLAPPRGKSGAKFHRHPNHLNDWQLCGLRFKNINSNKRVPCEPVECIEAPDGERQPKKRYLFALGKKAVNK